MDWIMRTHRGLESSEAPAADVPADVATTAAHGCTVFAFLLPLNQRTAPAEWLATIAAAYKPTAKRDATIAALRLVLMPEAAPAELAPAA